MKTEPDYYARRFNNCAEYIATTYNGCLGHVKPSTTTKDQLLKYRQRLLPKNGLIFKTRDLFYMKTLRSSNDYLPILMMCDKTAFIDNEMNVKAFVIEAQYVSAKSNNGEYLTTFSFSTGDSGFFVWWTGWKMIVSGIAETYPLQLLRQKKYLQLLYFHQHGIIQVWYDWYSRLFSPVSDLERKQREIEAFQRHPHKLTLDINVVSMFLIWGLCLGLCVFTFLIFIIM